jgi:hypothetical protein
MPLREQRATKVATTNSAVWWIQYSTNVLVCQIGDRGWRGGGWVLLALGSGGMPVGLRGWGIRGQGEDKGRHVKACQFSPVTGPLVFGQSGPRPEMTLVRLLTKNRATIVARQGHGVDSIGTFF